MGDIAVAASLAIRNFQQGMPACELEVGAAKIERKSELAALTRKVFAEFLQIGAELGIGFPQLRGGGVQFLLASFEFEANQALRGSD